MKKRLPGDTIAWVDVDSILLDFYTYFHKHLSEKYSIHIPPGYIPESWTYEGLLGEHKFTDVFDSMPTDWTLHLKAYEGAKEFTQKLHKNGRYVILVTHVPEAQKVNRMKCLIDQEIYFDEIYFPFGSPKSTVIQALSPRFESSNGKIKNIFVDDYMKNIIDVAALPNIDQCFSLNYPLNSKLIPSDKNLLRKIDWESQNPKELYSTVFKYLSKVK